MRIKPGMPIVAGLIAMLSGNVWLSGNAWAAFKHVATHPEAANTFHSTPQNSSTYHVSHRGREIKVLRAFKSRLYIGYGQDDGPNKPGSCAPYYVSAAGAPWCALVVRYYDPATGRLSAPQGSIRSQELSTLEVMGGSLYGLAEDREGRDDYIKCSASGCRGGMVDAASTAHLYSATEMNGVIYMAGSSGRDGVIWKSSNGGAHWTETLRAKAEKGASDFSRFYEVGGPVYGLVYAHARDWFNGYQLHSKTHDGKASNKWVNHTVGLETYLPTFRLRGFANTAIYIEGVELKEYNGVTSRLHSVAHVHDFAIADGWLYALSNASGQHKIFRTKDLKSWRHFDTAPSTAISIEVVAGNVYVGTTDAKIYKSDVSLDENTVVMAPIYYLLLN